MEDSRWAKKVMKWREENSKTLKDFKRRAEKMDIWVNRREITLQVTVEGNRNTVQRMQGEVRTENAIVKEIERKVKKRGLSKWRENVRKKPSLKIYTNKDIQRRELFYDGS